VHAAATTTTPFLTDLPSLGFLDIEFPRSSDLFELFECTETMKTEYDYDSFVQGMRALTVLTACCNPAASRALAVGCCGCGRCT